VIVEVELFVELPPRRPEMEWNRRHLLPQPRNLPAGVGEPIAEALKIRATVEQRDCDDRASQTRVTLDAPQERVRFVEVGR